MTHLLMEMEWIRVKVYPNAKKEALVQLGPERFEAWVKAKPVEGRANAALVSLLARSLQIQPEHLRLVRGGTGRQKLFQVIG